MSQKKKKENEPSNSGLRGAKVDNKTESHEGKSKIITCVSTKVLVNFCA